MRTLADRVSTLTQAPSMTLGRISREERDEAARNVHRQSCDVPTRATRHGNSGAQAATLLSCTYRFDTRKSRLNASSRPTPVQYELALGS